MPRYGNDVTIGFLGLGAMGNPMARNLAAAGYRLVVFDPEPSRVASLVESGAEAGQSEVDVCRRTEVVMTSLRSSDLFVEVAENKLLPHAREGQVFVDLGTTSTIETRRLARAFAATGARLVDAPVSGGPQGAEAGALRMFLGGEEEAVQRVLPVLHVLGDPARVVYCGPSGCGQVVKYVNQLAMGLSAAACLEALALAVMAGIDPEVVAQGVGGGEGWREHFASIARRVAHGGGDSIWVKFPELPLFITEAREQGQPLPLTEALHAFLAAAEPLYRDNMNRPTASFWRELCASSRHFPRATDPERSR